MLLLWLSSEQLGSALDVAQDPGPIASAGIAASLALVVRAVRFGGAPAWLVWVPAVIVAAAVDGLDVTPYGVESVEDIQIVHLLLVAISFLFFAIAVGSQGRRPPESGGDLELSLNVAVASAGITLCVPETGVLFLLVAPLLIASSAARAGWLRPFASWELLLIGAVLAWITLLDGGERGSAIVGGSACLAAAGILAMVGRTSQRRSAARSPAVDRWLRPIVVIAVIVVCSRVGGVNPSTAFAAAISLIALAAGVAMLWTLERFGHRLA